jgi:hypothetical protein
MTAPTRVHWLPWKVRDRRTCTPRCNPQLQTSRARCRESSGTARSRAKYERWAESCHAASLRPAALHIDTTRAAARQIRYGRCAADPSTCRTGQMGVLPHGTRCGAMDSPTAVGGTAEVSLTATLRTLANLFNVRIRSFPGLAVTKSLMTMSTSP